MSNKSPIPKGATHYKKIRGTIVYFKPAVYFNVKEERWLVCGMFGQWVPNMHSLRGLKEIKKDKQL